MGGIVFIDIVGIVHVAVVVSVEVFVRGVRVRESDGRRSTADIRSLLEGRREVAGAAVGCAGGSMRVGSSGSGFVGGVGTDGILGAGEFMVEGFFGVGGGWCVVADGKRFCTHVGCTPFYFSNICTS